MKEPLCRFAVDWSRVLKSLVYGMINLIKIGVIANRLNLRLVATITSAFNNQHRLSGLSDHLL